MANLIIRIRNISDDNAAALLELLAGVDHTVTPVD